MTTPYLKGVMNGAGWNLPFTQFMQAFGAAMPPVNVPWGNLFNHLAAQDSVYSAKAQGPVNLGVFPGAFPGQINSPSSVGKLSSFFLFFNPDTAGPVTGDAAVPVESGGIDGSYVNVESVRPPVDQLRVAMMALDELLSPEGWSDRLQDAENSSRAEVFFAREETVRRRGSHFRSGDTAEAKYPFFKGVKPEHVHLVPVMAEIISAAVRGSFTPFSLELRSIAEEMSLSRLRRLLIGGLDASVGEIEKSFRYGRGVDVKVSYRFIRTVRDIFLRGPTVKLILRSLLSCLPAGTVHG